MNSTPGMDGAPRGLGSLFDLSGSTALVIGAGSGIGGAAARGLAAHRAAVTCADVNADSAEQTAASIRQSGAIATSAAVDITSAESVRQLLASVPTPDALVITPATNVRKRITAMSDDEFDRVVNLNLKGTFRMVRDVGAAMAERGRGSIIAFASIRAQVVEPGQGAYAATKAGVVQLIKVVAAELGPSGVRANSIAPGIVETPLTATITSQAEWHKAYAAKPILRRWAQPEELVGAVVFLASAASSYVTGTCIYVDGGWTAADGRFDPPL